MPFVDLKADPTKQAFARGGAVQFFPEPDDGGHLEEFISGLGGQTAGTPEAGEVRFL